MFCSFFDDLADFFLGEEIFVNEVLKFWEELVIVSI